MFQHPGTCPKSIKEIQAMKSIPLSGVYVITNNVNGKKYIGQSVDVLGRLQRHKTNLIRGTHRNTHLQNAYIKHGGKNFSFSVACKCSRSDLDSVEQRLISQYKTTDRNYGYNVDSGGNANKTFGETHRKKISEALLGRIGGMLGKHHSDETRKKISDGNKGKTISQEARRKTSDRLKKNPIRFWLGKKRSPETIKKIVKNLKNNNWKGKTFSEEHRRKLSEASKRAWEKRKNGQ
jgi:group I intron endonuclease